MTLTSSFTFAVMLGISAVGSTGDPAQATSSAGGAAAIKAITGAQRRWVNTHEDVQYLALREAVRIGDPRDAQASVVRAGASEIIRPAGGHFEVLRQGSAPVLSRRYYGKPQRLGWGDVWRPKNENNTPALDWAVAIVFSGALGSLTPWPLIGALITALIGSGIWSEWISRPKVESLRSLSLLRTAQSA